MSVKIGIIIAVLVLGGLGGFYYITKSPLPFVSLDSLDNESQSVDIEQDIQNSEGDEADLSEIDSAIDELSSSASDVAVTFDSKELTSEFNSIDITSDLSASISDDSSMAEVDGLIGEF